MHWTLLIGQWTHSEESIEKTDGQMDCDFDTLHIQLAGYSAESLIRGSSLSDIARKQTDHIMIHEDRCPSSRRGEYIARFVNAERSEGEIRAQGDSYSSACEG